MATDTSSRPIVSPARGRLYLWLGLALCVLGMVLVVLQYAARQLIVPWYLPAMTTLGAVSVLYAVGQRRTTVRIVALLLIASLAGLEWYFLGVEAKLPVYAGPAKAGAEIPAFRTALADGRPFTEEDLQDGVPSVLVFFRGRW